MKKIIALWVLAMVGFILMAKADVTTASSVTFPTTAQNAFLNGQVIVTLINHGTFAEEYRQGEKQVILSDNIIEAGHVGGQYLFGLDGSVYQDPLKSNLDFEGGIRLNLHAIVNRFVTLTPQWQMVLGNLEYYPRVGYDFGKSDAHSWFATFNLGFGFGAGSGTPQ